jgi:type IV secretory pathway VirB2 component (pilin)
MKLSLKEDPKEWRKTVLLAACGFAGLSTVLRWRHVILTGVYIGILAVLLALAVCACLRPAWFRGYYRFSNRMAFAVIRAIGCVFLAVFFFLVLTPFGLIRRLLGRDDLQLKMDPGAKSYWQPARKNSSLNDLF